MDSLISFEDDDGFIEVHKNSTGLRHESGVGNNDGNGCEEQVSEAVNNFKSDEYEIVEDEQQIQSGHLPQNQTQLSVLTDHNVEQSLERHVFFKADAVNEELDTRTYNGSSPDATTETMEDMDLPEVDYEKVNSLGVNDDVPDISLDFSLAENATVLESDLLKSKGLLNRSCLKNRRKPTRRPSLRDLEAGEEGIQEADEIIDKADEGRSKEGRELKYEVEEAEKPLVTIRVPESSVEKPDAVDKIGPSSNIEVDDENRSDEYIAELRHIPPDDSTKNEEPIKVKKKLPGVVRVLPKELTGKAEPVFPKLRSTQAQKPTSEPAHQQSTVQWPVQLRKTNNELTSGALERRASSSSETGFNPPISPVSGPISPQTTSPLRRPLAGDKSPHIRKSLTSVPDDHSASGATQTWQVKLRKTNNELFSGSGAREVQAPAAETGKGRREPSWTSKAQAKSERVAQAMLYSKPTETKQSSNFQLSTVSLRPTKASIKSTLPGDTKTSDSPISTDETAAPSELNVESVHKNSDTMTSNGHNSLTTPETGDSEVPRGLTEKKSLPPLQLTTQRSHESEHESGVLGTIVLSPRRTSSSSFAKQSEFPIKLGEEPSWMQQLKNQVKKSHDSTPLTQVHSSPSAQPIKPLKPLNLRLSSIDKIEVATACQEKPVKPIKPLKSSMSLRVKGSPGLVNAAPEAANTGGPSLWEREWKNRRKTQTRATILPSSRKDDLPEFVKVAQELKTRSPHIGSTTSEDVLRK